MKECRFRQLAFVSALSLFGAGSILAIPPGSAAGASSLVSAEVTAALHHLVGPPAGTQALAPYVQGMDPAMAKALAAGAGQQRANSSYLLPDGTVTAVTDVVQASAVATFDFYISNSSAAWLHPGVLRDCRSERRALEALVGDSVHAGRAGGRGLPGSPSRG